MSQEHLCVRLEWWNYGIFPSFSVRWYDYSFTQSLIVTIIRSLVEEIWQTKFEVKFISLSYSYPVRVFMRTFFFFQCTRIDFDVCESIKVVSAKRLPCMLIDLYAKNDRLHRFRITRMPASSRWFSNEFTHNCFSFHKISNTFFWHELKVSLITQLVKMIRDCMVF